MITFFVIEIALIILIVLLYYGFKKEKDYSIKILTLSSLCLWLINNTFSITAELHLYELKPCHSAINSILALSVAILFVGFGLTIRDKPSERNDRRNAIITIIILVINSSFFLMLTPILPNELTERALSLPPLSSTGSVYFDVLSSMAAVGYSVALFKLLEKRNYFFRFGIMFLIISRSLIALQHITPSEDIINIMGKCEMVTLLLTVIFLISGFSRQKINLKRAKKTL